jgi:pseudoazurin
MRLLLILVITFMFVKPAAAETLQISFTEHDSYSIEVAQINVGDTIEWFPVNKGHNVEFLAGPEMSNLPEKSELNVFHSVVFEIPGVYLYHCTPHGNMGMLGLVVVGNDLHNLKLIEKIDLSRVANSVLQRLIRIAKSI